MEQLIAELGYWSILLIPLFIVIAVVFVGAAIAVAGMILWLFIKLVFAVSVLVIVYSIWAAVMGYPQLWQM